MLDKIHICLFEGEFPPEYIEDSDDEDYPEDETTNSTVDKRPLSAASANNDNQTQNKGLYLT